MFDIMAFPNEEEETHQVEAIEELLEELPKPEHNSDSLEKAIMNSRTMNEGDEMEQEIQDTLTQMELQPG
jgi:hypothetical protein